MPTLNTPSRLIYLDNHATTPVDPRVIEAMLPLMSTAYANPGSVNHRAGREVAEQMDQAIQSIADTLNAHADEIVITSGATESNNLALFGFATHAKQSRRKIVSMGTEHRAILDPLNRLQKLGFEIVSIPCVTHDYSGAIDLAECINSIDEQTALVSIMLANNEIGTIQPIRTISKRCEEFGVILHTDASQAVGKLPVDVKQLGVDLLSFSAHKFYGPKGVGGLYIRSDAPRAIKMQPQILGGGHQRNLRSGTLNSTGIVGMAKALEIAQQSMDAERAHAMNLRNRLWRLLNDRIDGLLLNGPTFSFENVTSHSKPSINDSHGGQPHDPSSASILRLEGNLNVCFPKVDGQSLMLAIPDLAVSSGSACTSAEPHPSHVLLGIGRTADQARASLRFGIGRFNTTDEIDIAADWISAVHTKLASLVA